MSHRLFTPFKIAIIILLLYMCTINAENVSLIDSILLKFNKTFLSSLVAESPLFKEMISKDRRVQNVCITQLHTDFST